ncbi:MAG: inverse autotransporter beta domain-containing protein [bacterium]
MNEKSLFNLLFCLVMTGSALADPAELAVSQMPWSQPLPSGQLNLGVHFGDQQVESLGDVLIPVLHRQTDLIFVNPRGTWNDDDREACSFGLGGRHLFPAKNIIIGCALFYDRQNTELGNTFNQAGCGVEFLSTWLDARLNGYFPENGEKTANDYVVSTGTSQEHAEYWYAPTAQGHVISQYGYELTDSFNIKKLQHYQTAERAMDGFDAEIGALLPIPVLREFADIKAFAGCYGYQASFGDDVSGVKGRLEIRPLPAVYLDAGWFEDEKLFGSHYAVGVRAAVPFDLARLSRGQNPFAGALTGNKTGSGRVPFANRLTEMVIRDLHIRTEASLPVEVVADRRVLEKTCVAHDRKDYTEILAADVTFVDGDQRGGLQNGTWENPYRQINTGVQNAIGNLVYVSDAVGQYHENVVLHEGVTLWGSGAPIYGRHGTFQGRGYPVVNGGGAGPTITLANYVTVTGFELIQPAGAPLSSAVIYGQNVSDVTIIDNTIRGNGSAAAGIKMQASSIPAFNAIIWNNRIMGALGAGIDISLGLVLSSDMALGRNMVTGNTGDGVGISATACGDFHVSISGNYSGNGGNGIALQAFTSDIVAKLSDVTANDNLGSGVFADIYSYNSANASFSHVDARANQLDGLHAVLVSGGSVGADFMNNRLTGNGADGLFIDLNSGLDSGFVARGNVITGNGANGIDFHTLAPWDSLYDFGMTGGGAADSGLNHLYGNGAYQLLFDGPGTLWAAGNWWGSPGPVANVYYRAEGGGLIIVDPALPTP